MHFRSILLLLCFVAIQASAQSTQVRGNNPSFTVRPGDGQGSLVIHQEERLNVLLQRFEDVQKNRKGMPGYRIQIYFGSGRTARNDAYEAKANFLTKFADFPAYVVYQSPFYKVRVGDFRSKREASDLLMKVQRTFPNAYITPLETINLPPLD